MTQAARTVIVGLAKRHVRLMERPAALKKGFSDFTILPWSDASLCGQLRT